MKKYYLHNGTEQEGPFSVEELKAKNISRQTPVWHEGLTDWVNAETILELKDIFTAAPPPYVASTPPPVQKISPDIQSTSIERNDRARGMRVIFIGLAIIALAVVGYYFVDGAAYNASSESYQEKVMSVEEVERSQPVNFLVADGKYNENLWGDKLKVHGTITNKATVATYKDAVVRITYYSKTKTELGSKEYTIYETFPPNTTSNFELKIDNFTDVNSINWDVVSAVAK